MSAKTAVQGMDLVRRFVYTMYIFIHSLSCVSDALASLAARVMAIQLCGERHIAASQSALLRLADDPSQSLVVRKSAERVLGKFDTIPAWRE